MRVLLFLAGAVVGAAFFLVSPRTARQPPRKPKQEVSVDTTSEDSFPASDPPSWTGAVVGGSAGRGTH